MRSLVAILLLTVLAGCGPSLKRDGGYVLTYRVAAEEKSPDLQALAGSVQRRLKIGGYTHAQVRSEDKSIVIELAGADEAEAESAQRLIQALGSLELRVVAAKGFDDSLIEKASSADNAEADKAASDEYDWVRIDQKVDYLKGPEAIIRIFDGEEQVLLIVSPDDITSVDFEWVGKSLDESLNYKVDARLNPDATEKMTRLSSKNLKRRLAIVFDDEVVSAPVVQSALGANLQITGHFEEDEVDRMVAVMSAGSQPGRLEPEPISVTKIQPQ